MTAEIAVLNKDAIALASDSAVSMIGGSAPKIFPSANKLFSLSKYQPIGLMIYGNANFMGIPWETIITFYRNTIGKKQLNTLEDYVVNFTEFLEKDALLFPTQLQKKYVYRYVKSYYNLIRNNIAKEAANIIESKKELKIEEFKDITTRHIDEEYEKLERLEYLPNLPERFIDSLVNTYNELFEDIMKEVFEKALLHSDKRKLERIAINIFAKDMSSNDSEGYSGFVVAGFGEKEIFPSIEAFKFKNIADKKLIYLKDISKKIDHDNHSQIISFGQKDMIETFVTGIDPKYKEYIKGNYKGLISYYEKYMRTKYPDIEIPNYEEVLGIYLNSMEQFSLKEHVDPFSRIISFLPKSELATIAETLVSLSSFKRRVTMQTETVAGPIDVALISKADGFIWVKRKRYFEVELNPELYPKYIFKSKVEGAK